MFYLFAQCFWKFAFRAVHYIKNYTWENGMQREGLLFCPLGGHYEII